MVLSGKEAGKQLQKVDLPASPAAPLEGVEHDDVIVFILRRARHP
jgi:hypothetical protein